MTPSWPGDGLTRWSRRVLGAASRLVPSRSRDAWREEWEAELWQLRQAGSSLWSTATFLAGACWHGLWERKEGWGLEDTLQDVRYALRTLRRSPGFTAAALSMLALSIGGTTALFSVLQRSVLATPPYPEPDRLVVVDMLFGMDDGPKNPSQWSYPRLEAMREEVDLVEPMAGYALRTATLTELGDPTVVPVEVATPELFGLLGVQATVGRVFGAGEQYEGAARAVALVGDGFWRTRMGASPTAVGSIITLDQLRFEVIGVLPTGFEGLTGQAEVWIPMAALPSLEDPGILDDPWNQHFQILGKLAPGTTLEAARAQVAAFGATIMERFPGPVATSRLSSGADLVPLAQARQNPKAASSMLALFGAVFMVLLIATANLAGLLLARGARRRQETAIRCSLGAGRSRILRQLLTEALVLAGIGGALGIVLASAGVDSLGAWLAGAVGTNGTRGLEYFDAGSLAVDWRAVLFAALLTGGVGVACGIVPGLRAARVDASSWLKGSGAVGRPRGRLARAIGGDALILGQVAVAVVLLTGAMLMIESLRALGRTESGYLPDRMLTAIYGLSPADEQAGVDPATFHTSFLERVRGLPGVAGASLGEVPMGGPTWRTIVLGVEGRPELTPAMHTWARIQPVADGHFALLGTRLLEGREIERADDWNTERVVVLGRTAAEELFPDGRPLGRRIQLGWSGYGGDGARVVGVVDDIRYAGPDLPTERQVYVALRQSPRLETGLLVRTEGDPSTMAGAIRAALAELGPNVALTSVMTMDERTASATARPRVVTLLLGVFSGLSLFLVAAGLYGSIALAVARRTREIGLRSSLGAGRGSLVALVLREGMGVTLAGIVLGLLGSLWATRLLTGMLHDTGPNEPGALAGAALLLVVVAVLAAWLPARRATRIDPMSALRSE
ncbi:MAG: ABC transporter permease [Gemmatimonadales bacterium]